jgi:hypothetical protein
MQGKLVEFLSIVRVLAGEQPHVEGHGGQEHVGDELGVLLPVLAVLLQAAHLVAGLAVHDHAGEEGDVEVGQEGAEPAGQAPGGGHDDVAGVLHLAREGVPAADEQVALGGLDVGDGLLQDGPGNLRKAHRAAHADFAGGLLAVGRVEHVVADQQEDEVGVNQVLGIGRGNGLLVAQDVERLEAVQEGYAADVPEVEHPPEVLVEHVPGAGDAVLALGGGVGVQPVGHHHEEHVGGDVAQGLVLLDGAGRGQKHERDPRPAALRHHLDVHDADARVQDRTHEEVVDDVSGPGRLAVVLVGEGQAVEVPEHSGHISDNHGGDQELAIVVGQIGHIKVARVVHDEKQHAR